MTNISCNKCAQLFVILLLGFIVIRICQNLEQPSQVCFPLWLASPLAKASEAEHPSATNRTQDGLVLVFNRVPKCSSTSMYKLIIELSHQNHFHSTIAKSDDIRNELRSPQKERELITAMKGLPKNGVYVRHMYNPDWARLGVKVNLVNMIRDPISRMASWFYFIR